MLMLLYLTSLRAEICFDSHNNDLLSPHASRTHIRFESMSSLHLECHFYTQGSKFAYIN